MRRNWFKMYCQRCVKHRFAYRTFFIYICIYIIYTYIYCQKRKKWKWKFYRKTIMFECHGEQGCSSMKLREIMYRIYRRMLMCTTTLNTINFFFPFYWNRRFPRKGRETYLFLHFSRSLVHSKWFFLIVLSFIYHLY